MKRSTRLVYLHQYYKSAAEVGGIRSHEFAKRLAAAGYDVHVVTTNRGADGQPGWSQEDVAGFTVHRIHVPYSNRMSYFARIKAFAKYALTAGLRARASRQYRVRNKYPAYSHHSGVGREGIPADSDCVRSAGSLARAADRRRRITESGDEVGRWGA